MRVVCHDENYVLW